MLAFTTVALGGFRGLISNLLWIRANDLQIDDKFFEAAQLADWITDLEPHFAQVWAFQAWNMAYNISVKFKENAPGDYSDRWRWVQRGIELLRDEGLRYNPDERLDLPATGLVLPAQDRRKISTTEICITNSSGPRTWRRSSAANGTNFDELDPSADRRGPDQRAGAPRKIQD